MRWLRSAQQWLCTRRYLDLFYGYYLDGLSGYRHVLHEIAELYRPLEEKRKKPSYLPQLEGLELRQMMTTVPITAYVVSDDPKNVPLVNLGEVSADLNTGSVDVSQKLDFSLSPTTCGCIDGDPALTYNGATVDVKPIIDISVDTTGMTSTPTLKVTLTLDGTAQTPVTLMPTGSWSLGDPLMVAVESTSPVATTGAHPYSVNVEADCSGAVYGTGTTSGVAYEVVQDTTQGYYGAADPVGAGWGISGIDHLVSINAGTVLMVYGTGNSRLFTGSGGTLTAGGDFGTLTATSGSYAYAATGWIQSEQFDGTGLLTKVITTSGFTRTYGYDSNNLLTQVIAGDNSTTTLAYDPTTHFLQTITEPSGHVVTVTESVSGGVAHLTGISDPEPLSGATYVRTMAYNTSNQLTSDSLDPYATGLSYNGSTGLLDQVELGTGTTLAVDYGITSAASEPLAAEIDTSLSGLATQAAVTDPLSHVATYGLDKSGRITSMASAVAPAASITGASWNSTTKLATITATNSFAVGDKVAIAGITGATNLDGTFTVVSDTSTSFTYSVPSSTGTVTLSSASATAIPASSQSSSFDSNGLLTQSIDGDGNTTNFTFDAHGKVTGQTGPVTNESIAYSRDGTIFDNVTQTVEYTTPTTAITTTAKYDTNGHMTQSVDGDGHTTSYAWTGNYMTSMVSPIGVIGTLTAASWSANVATITASNNLSVGDTVAISGVTGATGYNGVFTVLSASGTTFTYALGSSPGTATLTTASASAGTQTWAYDANGHLTKSVDADFRTTLYTYDAGGNLSTVTDPLTHVTSYTYDADHRLIAQTNPAGDSATYSYDAAGMQTASVVGGISSSYTYDARGWMTQSTDGNNHATTYGYDAAGHQTSTSLLNTQQQKFDSAGQLVESINGLSAVTTYSYDGAGNLTKTVDPDNHTTTQSYDAANQLLSTTDPLGRTTSSAYDLMGRVTATTDGMTVTTYSEYDNNSNLTATIDGRTNTTYYTYDLLNNPSQTRTPLATVSATIVYATTTQYYDAANQLMASADADGHTTLYSYDLAGNLTQTLLPKSTTTGTITYETTTQSYDADNRLTKTVDPDSRTTTQAYDSAGRVTQTVSGTHTSSTTYDGNGNVLTSTDGAGAVTSNLYDYDNNVTASVAANGQTVLYTYDAADQLISTSDVTTTADPQVRNTSNYYDAAGYMTLALDANGHATQSFYDADGEVTMTVIGGSLVTGSVVGGLQTTLQNYDNDGRLVSTVENTGSTLFTATNLYDANGNLTQSTDYDGNISKSYFDLANRATMSIDGAGATTQQIYDPASFVTKSIDGNGNTTTMSYDWAGNVTLVTTPLGHTTQNFYDLANQVTQTVDADGHTSSMQYDSNGLVTESIDGDNYTRSTKYDGDGRVLSTVDGDLHTTTYKYDGMGNVTQITDANTHAQHSYFDLAGDLTLSVDGATHSTSYTYDAVGNQLSVTDPDTHVTSYGYDSANEQTSVTDADTNVTTYAFDGAGRATKVVANGHTTTQVYDGNGNRIDVITPNTATVAYNYDGDGRMLTDGNGTLTYDHDGHVLSAYNSNGTYAFSYDGDGQLTLVTEPYGFSLNYAYDHAGNQTEVVDSFGGTVVSTYDGDRFLTERTYDDATQREMRVDFQYNKEGQITRQTDYSNLSATTLVADIYTGYDNVGNVTSILAINISTATINQFKYAYDSANRLTSETDTQNGATTTTSYSYDSAGQLTNAATSGVSTLTYGYDATGNRNNGSNTVGSDNQMSGDASWTYKYDNNGNLVEKDTKTGGSSENWTYAYSSTNELTEVKHYNSSGALVESIDYTYDAFGQMIQSVDTSGPSEKFGLDGWNSNMASPIGHENMNAWVHAKNGSVEHTRYLWGDKVSEELGRVDYTASPPVVYWTLTDHLNSVRDVIDNTGTVQDDLQYDAYGNLTDTNSTYRGWYAYAGQQTDPTTGLQYDHERWYDASMGKWISQDPMGFDAGDSNLYRYVNNRPTVETDPSGLEATCGGFVNAKDKKLQVQIETSGEPIKGFPLGPYNDSNSVGFAFGVKIDYNGGIKKVELTQTYWSLSEVVYKRAKVAVIGVPPRKDWGKLNDRYIYPTGDEYTKALKAWTDKTLKLTDMVDDHSELWNKLLQGTDTGDNAKVSDNSFQYVDLPGFPGKFAKNNKKVWLEASAADSYKVYAMYRITAKTTDGSNLEESKMFGYWLDASSDGKTWAIKKGETWSFDPTNGKFLKVDKTF